MFVFERVRVLMFSCVGMCVCVSQADDRLYVRHGGPRVLGVGDDRSHVGNLQVSTHQRSQYNELLS